MGFLVEVVDIFADAIRFGVWCVDIVGSGVESLVDKVVLMGGPTDVTIWGVFVLEALE